MTEVDSMLTTVTCATKGLLQMRDEVIDTIVHLTMVEPTPVSVERISEVTGASGSIVRGAIEAAKMHGLVDAADIGRFPIHQCDNTCINSWGDQATVRCAACKRLVSDCCGDSGIFDWMCFCGSQEVLTSEPDDVELVALAALEELMTHGQKPPTN
jgi:hypothetical protein